MGQANVSMLKRKYKYVILFAFIYRHALNRSWQVINISQVRPLGGVEDTARVCGHVCCTYIKMYTSNR